MSPIADGMLQCRNRKAISELILSFILETSYRIIKGRNSKSYLLTVEKSTEKNHQNFDECGIQYLTVMTDFITEHSSTQETNTMDEHEMQSLCYRRRKYNLLIFLVFFVFVLCLFFLCVCLCLFCFGLRPVSCVTNVASVSRLSILYYPSVSS